MRRIIKCEKCGELKENCAKGLCKKCYERIYRQKHGGQTDAMREKAEYQRKYYKEHPKEVTLNILRATTCRILDAHHNDLIDDENRLSTQYIIDMCTDVKPNGWRDCK